MIRGNERRAGPRRGRYLVGTWWAYLYLTAVDALGHVLVRKTRWERPRDPRRILVGIGGHIGDAIIASSVLRALQASFPDAEIGVAASPSALAAIGDHPVIRYRHPVEHWRADRSTTSLATKWLQWARRFRATSESLRQVRYDVAVDLYPYHPNMSFLFWHAGIPLRLGYDSGGAGPLYTRAVPWAFGREHVAEQHQHLLGALADRRYEPPRYDLPPIPASALNAALHLQQTHRLTGGGYVILHVGVGDPRKAWRDDRWLDLVEQLSKDGTMILLTGLVPHDEALGERIVQEHPRVVNLIGKTSIPVLRALIRDAQLVVGLDSAVAHFAAADDIPTVVLMSGMSDFLHWRPLSDRSKVVTNATPCAPCFRSRGCADMTCVREIAVSDVVDAAVTIRETA